MKRLISFLLLMGTLAAVQADDLDAIQGKWRVKKNGERGSYIQQLEFKKNQWIFKIIDNEDRVTFVAVGEIELKKAPPFNVARFYKMKAGRSETELEPSDEERHSVYLLDNGVLYIGSSFDKPREREKPNADAYTKAD